MVLKIIYSNGRRFQLFHMGNWGNINTRIKKLREKNPKAQYKYVRIAGGRNALWALYIRR